MVAVALLVLTIVLILIATSLPWWTRSNSNGVTQISYLAEGCSDGRCVSYQAYPPLGNMFGLTDTLVLTAFVLSIATIGVFILSLFRPEARIGVLVAGIGGAIPLLAAPLYLFFALPETITLYSPYDVVASFFGSCTPSGSGSGCTIPEWWGGGAGWFMAIAASVVFLVSTLVGFSASRKVQQKRER